METKCNKINFCVFFSSKYYFCSPRFFSRPWNRFRWCVRLSSGGLKRTETSCGRFRRNFFLTIEQRWWISPVSRHDWSESSARLEPSTHRLFPKWESTTQHDTKFTFHFYFTMNNFLSTQMIISMRSESSFSPQIFFAWMKKWNWVERKNFMTQQQ